MDSQPQIDRLIELALAEDVGSGDVTSELTIAEDAMASALVLQKQDGVAFGFDVAARVFRTVDRELEWQPLAAEGSWQKAPVELARVSGSTRSILTAERVALNFLQHLSGVATLTAQFVNEVAGTTTKVLDTRKTTPAMRLLEKEAVKAGGGFNHRMGLYDAILIKDNHIAAAGGVAEAIDAARAGGNNLPIEVECADLKQLNDALSSGVERVLLDNMDLVQIRESVGLARRKTEVEVSGGVTLVNIGEIAKCGVDYISVGPLTHSAPALDISLTLQR